MAGTTSRVPRYELHGAYIWSVQCMIYYRQLGSGLPSPSNGFCDGIFPVVSFSDFEYAGLYEQLICSNLLGV